MAKQPDPFHEFVAELFDQLGPIRSRRMFGGAGVYAHDAMFALLADDVIYLKTDDSLRAELEEEGAEPFRFEKKDGSITQMSYFRLPDAAMDNQDEACDWGRKALDVALKSKANQTLKKDPKH